MTDSQNPNVITSWNSHSDSKHYHTDICRNVWQIQNKRYITEAEAERRGLAECEYCADAVDPNKGDWSIYELAVEIGERRAAEGD